MKLMKSIFLAFAVLIMPALLTISCETTPVRDQCEIDNVGTTKVVNSTGYSIWTDVTWGNYTTNYEKFLKNGGSYKYLDVPAGSIEIWVSFDGDDWYYNYENLSACENLTYTWYLNSYKSTGYPIDLIIDGKSLEAHRGCDHPSKSKVWDYMQ